MGTAPRQVEGSRAWGSLPSPRSCRGAWGAERDRKSAGRASVGCQRQKAGYRDAPGKNLAFPMLREPLGTVTHSWASPLCLYPSATLQPCSKPWGASKYKPPDPRLAGRGSGGTCLQPGPAMEKTRPPWGLGCPPAPTRRVPWGFAKGAGLAPGWQSRAPGGQWEPLEPPRAPRPGCAQRALLFSHLSELQRAKWIFMKCY